MHLKMESDLLLSLSPSFNSYCSVNLAIVDRVVQELKTHSASNSTFTTTFDSTFQNSSPGNIHGQERKDQIANDFEFSSVCRDSVSSPVSAEDIFHNGQIRPVFPISKRDLYFGDKVKADGKKSSVRRIPLGKLFSEDRGDPPEEDEDLKRIPAVSMDRASSSSSGRNEKRWRFRNILQRSNSEAKDSFVFLSPKRSRSKNQNFPESPKVSVDKRRAKLVSSGEAVTSSSSPPPQEAAVATGLYWRNRPAKEADRKRSFLPYRRDLIGFFANVY